MSDDLDPIVERSIDISRLRLQLAAQTKRADALQRENMCDVCCGKGDPGTGVPCICGGSGLASRQGEGFRKLLQDAEQERDQWKQRAEELRELLHETLYAKDKTVLGNGHCIKSRARSIELWHNDPNFDAVKAAQEIQELQEQNHKQLVELSHKVLPERAALAPPSEPAKEQSV